MHISTTLIFCSIAIVRISGAGIVRLASGAPPAGHPRSYSAPRAPTPITIDGDIYKKAWEEVPWSQDFVEIRGDDAPVNAKPTSGTRTRMKMLWDDEFVYIATEMSANDWPITADFKKRNEPIYQKDSDIEVFLDVDGSNTNYKELEVNARNTVWNLLLNRPYSSAGAEHSGRIAKPGESMYWDVKGQKTAAKMYGSIGKKQPDGKWTAEMKLSHKDSLDRTGGVAPAVGKSWRINFSRVEKRGAVNWVWSPQMIWTPKEGKYVGQVNMHAPDAWGYIVFAEAGKAAGLAQDWVDPNWNVKAAAHQLFYAEKLASTPGGGGKLLSPAVLEKKNWVDAALFKGLDAEVTQASEGKWTARIQDSNGCVSTIQQDNLHAIHCATKLFGMRTAHFMTGLGFLTLLASFGGYLAFRHKAKLSGSSD